MCILLCLDLVFIIFFFFKQKTAYEMRISDWSSDVCSSDLSRLWLLRAMGGPGPSTIRATREHDRRSGATRLSAGTRRTGSAIIVSHSDRRWHGFRGKRPHRGHEDRKSVV